MTKVDALLVLVQAVADGRLSAAEFAAVCLPLYKHYPATYSSAEQYRAANDIFYLADDYWAGEGDPLPGTLTAEEVRTRAVELAARLRSLKD